MPNGALSSRVLPSSAAWQQLGALGTSPEGDLYVLDSGAQRLLEYPGAGARLVDPPRPVLASTSLSRELERAAEVLPLADIYLRFEDGSVGRFDRDGTLRPFVVRLTHG